MTWPSHVGGCSNKVESTGLRATESLYEAVVEPRRDRESYLTLGVHIKHARLHQERVFQRCVVLDDWPCVTARQQTAACQPSFSIHGAIVTGP